MATLRSLFIVDTKNGKIIKDHANKLGLGAGFKPNFNTIHAVDESRSLLWWRDGQTLCIFCLKTFNPLYVLEIIPFGTGNPS